MQHRIGRISAPGDAATFDDKISGASTTLTNTPSLDSGTDFVNGGGIRAAVASQFMFNTADQDEATLIGTANIGYNDTDTAITVELQSVDAVDINGTDHTIGYDTALNTVVEAIDKIRDTANSHNRLFLVEVMGRDAGDIALNAGIGAGAEEILIPEEDLGTDRLLESLKRSKKSGKTSSIIVVSEGDKIGKNIFELAEFIETNLEDYEVRVTVLGHIQRGGSPTSFDRVLASRMGVYSVDSLLNGLSNVMIGIKDDEMIHIQVDKAIKSRGEINKDLIRVFDIISI